MRHLKEVLPDMPLFERDKHLKEAVRRLSLITPLNHEEYCLIEAALVGRKTPLSEE